MNVSYDRSALPILHDCDLVVVGGSLGGMETALALARAGRRVTLVEARTYLGREITATLRPWIPAPVGDGIFPLPPLISDCIEASGASAADGEFPLRMDAIKIRLEDRLLDTGIKLVYASRPVGVCVEAGVLRGLVIANKSGRQVITCNAILDASTTAIVARLAGAEFEESPAGPVTVARTIEFDGVEGLDGCVLDVPSGLGLAGDRVIVHRGYRGPEHVLLEHEVAVMGGTGSALGLTRREAQARRRTAALAMYLCSSVPAFSEAFTGMSSYEVHGPYSPRMTEALAGWGESFRNVTVDESLDGCAASSFTGPFAGIWCLNDSVRAPESVLAQLRTPVGSARAGGALARVIREHWEEAVAVDGAVEPATSGPASAGSATPDGTRMVIREPDQPNPGRSYDECAVTPQPVSVLHTADVLVVGGGSSGAIAAIAAAREGVQTTLVDMNPGLGGTGTYGGIDMYWFPRRMGFVSELMDRLDEMHDRLGLRRPEGIMPTWNIEARICVLMDMAEDAGVSMLLNSMVVATIVEGRTVRGVVVATPTGPVAVLGRVVIDATGDGDVAAFAGADCVLGSSREHLVMYGSMAGSAKPGRFRNIKTSMVDITDVEDYTRMILAERRRREGGDHDHGVYLAPRESRHVTGDVLITLTDQLRRRCWPDVAYVAFSNCDIKGQHTSDWLRMGLQPPNLEIEIPYRALLPKDLENVLVVGKAFSATHDAIAALRMQPDLENLGGVAGLAAVAALRAGTSPRRLDVRALEGDLVKAGVLPDSVLSRELVPLEYSDDELESMVELLDGDKPLHSYSDQEVGKCYHGRVPIVDLMCAGPRVVPVLERALAQAAGPRQVLLAQALAGLGSAAGVPVLVSAIEEELSAGPLPERKAKIRHVGLPPNQGAAPHAACLTYSLGMARDDRALPVWQGIVGLLASATDEDVMDRYRSQYYYVDAVCFGAERLGDPRAIPILDKLHGYAPFHGRESFSGYQVDWLEERSAHLELLIGRALARCGSADGYRILIGYINDVRAPLATHAHAELAAISGLKLGKDAGVWSRWLNEQAEPLDPVPWAEPTDAVASWNEEMLIDANSSGKVRTS